MSNRLIVVEDDMAHVMLLKRYLARSAWSPEVHEFEYGKDALAHFATEAVPDDAIVLLDLNLPDMSGIDILRALRANPRYEALHVVVLTTSNLDHERNACVALGVDHFLEKPFEYSKLVELIEALDLVTT